MPISIKTRSKSVAVAVASIFVGFVGASSAGFAMAAQPGDSLSRVVTYGDLNLESQQGAATLYARLRFAARAVCAPFESRELGAKAAWQACFNDALNASVASIKKPLVSALHTQSVGRLSNNKS